MIDQKELNQKHDEVSSDYYEQGIKENYFQRLWHRKRFKEILKLIFPRKVRYLDIGCHGGFLMSRVVNKLEPVEVYGVDISKNHIAYCRKKYPHFNFQVADCSHLPFQDDYFDLITCFEVLEHLINPRQAIIEMKRCLKREGDLIIVIPIENRPFKIIWYLWTRLGRGRVWQETHINQIGPKELKSDLINSGFEILQMSKSNWHMLQLIKAKLKSE